MTTAAVTCGRVNTFMRKLLIIMKAVTLAVVTAVDEIVSPPKGADPGVSKHPSL
jgi:hypothetical protein